MVLNLVLPLPLILDEVVSHIDHFHIQSAIAAICQLFLFIRACLMLVKLN